MHSNIIVIIIIPLLLLKHLKAAEEGAQALI